jgi:hypothetical protein
MAGTVKANAVQLGDSSTATQNLTIRTNADGTFTIARGNVGATTQDILTIDASGNIAQPAMTASTAYTPTVSASSGTITTVGTTSGRYKQIGKLLYFSFTVPITTNGTAAGQMNVSMPPGFSGGPIASYFCGRETAVTGNLLQGYVSAAGTTMVVLTYSNAWPGGNGYSISCSGVIEIA